MADYILDIDAKFLQNLKAADAALAKSIANSKMLSSQFLNMVQRSQTFGKTLGNVQAALGKLGAGATVDFSKGIININAAAMTATDKVNLLTQSVQQLRAKYDELQSSTSKKGMTLKSSANLTDKSSVEAALKQAESKLTKNISPAKAENLRQQIELYKAALRELSKSDDQRTREAAEEVKKRVAEANREADAKIKQSDRETKVIQDNHKKLQKTLGEKTKAQPMDSRAAMDLAKQAKTVEQLKKAYKELERSRNNINPNTLEGRKQIQSLNKLMDQTKNKITRITGENRNLRDSFNYLSNIVDGLKGQLAMIFGVAAIKNYVNNLIRVHGQFEMINRSLEILLHSSARAERVWGQITNLALKSPFQISELATATKQLAAYRIESDKLYEKTKMLADISAGLGVQMSRLILAYGQVKAANFLRGTELRQFSEAGIDMLGQLAAYFTEIEGRAVSAADVFERISKRMVLFEDVDAVLTRVTSQGGTFYKMQEEQAKTLTGQIRNLKDEIDLMLHEIGQSTHGILLTVVRGIRYLIKNWRTIIPIIFGAVTAFTLMKTALMGYGIYLSIVNRKLAGYTATTVGATLATRGFNAALASNPIALLIVSLASLAAGIATYVVAANSMNEAGEETVETFNSVAKIFDEQAMQYDLLTSKIMALSDEIRRLEDEQKGLKETDKRYLQINEELALATSARGAAISSLININDEYASSINDISDALDRNTIKEKELADIYAARTAANAFDVDKIGGYFQAINTAYSTIFSKDSDLDAEIKGYFKSTNWLDSPYLFAGQAILRGDNEAPEDYMLRVWATRLKWFREIQNVPLLGDVDPESYKEMWKGYGDLFLVSEGGKAYENLRSMVLDSANQYMADLGINIDDIANNPELQGKVYEVYERVIAKLDDLDAGGQELLRQFLGSAFGFEWPDISPNLKPWQERYNDAINAYIKNLEITQGSAIAEMARRTMSLIRTEQTDVEQLKKELDEEIKGLEQEIFDYQTGSLYLTPLEYQDKVRELEWAKFSRSLLGGEKEKGRKESRFKDTMEAIDDIHKAFKNLEKDFDAGTAKTGAWEKYGAALDTALKKIGMTRDEFVAKFGDLTSEPSVTSALEWLAEQAKDLDEKFDIQQHLGEWTWELRLEGEKEEFNNAIKAIDDMFSGYTLSIELDKLHLPKDFAEDFFDVELLSLEDLRKRVYDAQSKFDGTDDAKKFEEYLRKIDDLEVKAQQERLKKYAEYSKAVVGDRAKVLLDSYYELEDIERTFELTNSLAFNKGLIDKSTKEQLERTGRTVTDLLSMSADELSDLFLTEDDLTRLRAFNDELLEQRDLAIDASKRKTQADLDAMDWEALKGSETFTLAMQDLSRVSEQALDKMISQITAYKAEWADMPYSEVKEMIEYIEKLEDAKLAYYSPNEIISNARSEMEKLGFSSTADAQTQMLEAEDKLITLRRELSIVEKMERLRSEGKDSEVLIAELRASGITDEAEITRFLGLQSETIKSDIAKEEANTANAAKYLKLQTKILEAYQERKERLNDIKNIVDKVFDGWDAVNGLFEDGSMNSAISDLTKELSNSVFDALGLVESFKLAKEGIKDGGTEAEIFGYKLNAAMGIIGWIVMAIQLIAKGLKFAFEQYDKALQEQIDAQVEKVEKLQNEYEDLEKAIGKAYNAVDLGRLTREATENIEDQIEATEKMIALEKDKKKADESAIKGWQDNIRDMKDRLEELRKDTFSTLTDGIVDDVLSATRDFVDAWHDAYEETGDGMKDLEQTFTDMLKNMLRQQASMTLISPFVERFKKQLEQYVNADDVELTKKEAEALRATWDEMAPQMNDALTAYFDAFKGILEPDYGELSGLEKGIQGMTEDQAEVLAAYWNSCRYLLANIDNTLASLATNVLGNGNSENPIVSALKRQTAVIEQIRDMVGSVIANGGGLSSHSLSYIRVNDA